MSGKFSFSNSHPVRQKQAHIGLNAQLLNLGQNYRSAGINNYIYQLVRHLPQVSDFHYTVWTGERGGDLAGIERRVTSLPTRRPPVRILWEQFVQPYAVARQQPDLLHGMAFVLPLLLRVPGIITIFDLTFLLVPEAFRPLNRLYLQTMTRVSARRAAHICSIAKHGKIDIVKYLGVPESNVTVVYPGLDPRFAVPPTGAEIAEFRRDKGLPERYMLYLGTLEPRKNVPALIRAFAAIKKHLNGVKLVLAGGKGWGFEDIFSEVERFSLQNEVYFPGFVPNEELRLWYAAADLFVYPSLYEGFGLPPLEAMACGTPVMTSNATSLTEVVGEAGVTIAPHDEELLAETMLELLNNPEELSTRREMGLQQAARFNWCRSAQVQTQVYRKVLEL